MNVSSVRTTRSHLALTIEQLHPLAALGVTNGAIVAFFIVAHVVKGRRRRRRACGRRIVVGRWHGSLTCWY